MLNPFWKKLYSKNFGKSQGRHSTSWEVLYHGLFLKKELFIKNLSIAPYASVTLKAANFGSSYAMEKVKLIFKINTNMKIKTNTSVNTMGNFELQFQMRPTTQSLPSPRSTP